MTINSPFQIAWQRGKSFGWAGTMALLVIFCIYGRMQLNADDQPPQKELTKQDKPFVLPPQNLRPNAAGPPPAWVMPTVTVALCVLGPLLVMILLLLWKQMREWNRSNEILQIANHPSRLVSDKYLAVVSPRCDITPDERKTVAAALRTWLSHPYAKQVHGLEQLEAGEHPNIPAPHIIEVIKSLPPEVLSRLDPVGCYWPVALLEVNAGTDLDRASEELQADIESIVGLVGFAADPSSYDAYTM